MKDRQFFQDFLFENIPIDIHEYPEVAAEYCDCYDGKCCKEVSLDKLLRISTEKEWNSLIDKLRGQIVVIIDDVVINNEEVLTFKEFYLDTYFYIISNVCKDCKVFGNK